ncbi:hypothetical protein D3C77_673630 [compost metagenome]
MCGCGPTRKPFSDAKIAGPAWSRKHQAPIIRRWRDGNSRLTGMPPPTSALREVIRWIARTPSLIGQSLDSDSSLWVSCVLMCCSSTGSRQAQRCAWPHPTSLLAMMISPLNTL